MTQSGRKGTAMTQDKDGLVERLKVRSQREVYDGRGAFRPDTENLLLAEALAHIQAQAALIKQMREALEPFAGVGEEMVRTAWCSALGDDHTIFGGYSFGHAKPVPSLSVGDFRRARQVLDQVGKGAA